MTKIFTRLVLMLNISVYYYTLSTFNNKIIFYSKYFKVAINVL